MHGRQLLSTNSRRLKHLCQVDAFVHLVWDTPKPVLRKADVLFSSRLASSRLVSSRLGFVHLLQDVALHQCLQLPSVCCFPNPGGSLLLCYVVLPSSAWSSSRSLPSPWLPLCAAFVPPIVLHSCNMTCPFPLLFQCVFSDINYLCSFPDF